MAGGVRIYTNSGTAQNKIKEASKVKLDAAFSFVVFLVCSITHYGKCPVRGQTATCNLNKHIRPIKTIVIFTARSTLCMASISSSTYFEIVSCTRMAILDIVTFYCDGVRLLTSTSKRISPNKTATFPVFCQQWLLIVLPWTITESCSQESPTS